MDQHPWPADPDSDPDPDSYPNMYSFQPIVRKNILFPDNFNMLSKIMKIMTPMAQTR